MGRRLQAVVAREGLVDILTLHPSRPVRAVVQAWVDGLDDDQVLATQDRVIRRHDKPVGLDALLRALIRDAYREASERR